MQGQKKKELKRKQKCGPAQPSLFLLYCADYILRQTNLLFCPVSLDKRDIFIFNLSSSSLWQTLFHCWIEYRIRLKMAFQSKIIFWGMKNINIGCKG